MEALASHQHVVLRDIPVYEGWIDEQSATLGKNNEEFVAGIQAILAGQVDKRERGYQVAESRSMDQVAQQLVTVYRQVLEM